MRINVICIYWFLFCVTVFSSCVLFILVASESEKLSSVNGNSNLENTVDNGINKSTNGRDEGISVEERVNEEGANLRSSFEEINQENNNPDVNSAGYGFGEHLSQNSGVSDQFSDTNGVIFTLVDTASAELQQKAENTLEPSSVEDKKNTSTVTLDVEVAPEIENKTDVNLELPKEEIVIETKQKIDISVNETDKKLNVSDDTKEEHDIPSFSEWTQKQLEEAEKKKEKGNTSVNSQNVVKNTNNMKLRSKNYASPDCGAKIIAANPESVSPGAVLSPSRDEYKLNTCTSRIWFIVELCEAIQAKKIDLANFELFSSSPKDFVVSVSDRFPSREWSSVGQFTAKDERDVQSFNLHPHLFGKFIKVEMLSHYGSEHFCPISLFRVYGTSEFEVLETEDLSQDISDDDDDDDDEPLDSYTGEPTNNLFGSARDAVISIVKKAAEVLVKSGDSNKTEKQDLNSTKYTPLINTCTTPSRIVVCNNCSDVMFGSVYELLSCKSEHLKKLLELKVFSNLLYNTDLCVDYGLNFFTKSPEKFTKSYAIYVSKFFPPKYIAAFCNVLAVIENKVVLNISSEFNNSSTTIEKIDEGIIKFEGNTKTVLETSCLTDSSTETKTCAGPTEELPDSTSNIQKTETISETLEIKPTKTLTSRIEEKIVPSSDLTDIPFDPVSKENLEPSEIVTMPGHQPGSVQQNNTVEETKTLTDHPTVTVEESSEAYEIPNEQLDKLLSELNLEHDSSSNVPTTIAPPSNVPQQAQKESVFLRLSSRIKALERNMSLSGQYLEELSRRYKKQVEEMQKAFEKKLTVVNEEMKKRDEREAKMQEQIMYLTESLSALLSERDGYWKTFSLIGQFLFMEIFVACILLYFCCRNTEDKSIENNNNVQELKTAKKRRQSIDTVGHESPVIIKNRRPSEEALKISGTYEDLLIKDGETNWQLSKAERRRRRKKNALLRTQSNMEQKDKIESLKRSQSFNVNNVARKQSAPAQIYVNGDVSPPVFNQLEDLPFPLEESEHTPVENFQVFNNNQENQVPNNNKVKNGGTLKSNILKSSPLFMKTALSARSKRNSGKLSFFKTDKNANGKIDNSDKINASSQRRSPDLSITAVSNLSDSADDRSSVSSISTVKKDKKSSGFKRIFKKVFD